MAYTHIDFKTKKALREALARGEKVYLKDPSPRTFWVGPIASKVQYLEGPWYPQAHTWYAQAKLDVTGRIVSVK